MGSNTSAADLRFAEAQAVADAIVFHGTSCDQGQVSVAESAWHRGTLAPPAWALHTAPRPGPGGGSGGTGEAHSWWQQTECLVQAGSGARVHLRIRFLRLERQWIEELAPDGYFRPPGRSVSGGAGSQFRPAAIDVSVSVADVLATGIRHEVCVPGEEEIEAIADARGHLAGRMRRRRLPVRARLAICACAADGGAGVLRLRVRVDNADHEVPAGAPRDRALAASMVATYVLVAIEPGSFVSLLDPPDWAVSMARDCVNIQAFPVLAGPPGRCDLLVSTPEPLDDHPHVPVANDAGALGHSALDLSLQVR